MSDSTVGRSGGRREARERAVELGYEADSRGLSVDEMLAALPLDPEPYSVVLLRSSEERRGEVEAMISAKATGWSLDRMPRLDLIVMRMAVAELLVGDTPRGVVLHEAVDLVSRYSTDESGRFVNGVLSAIARDIPTAE